MLKPRHALVATTVPLCAFSYGAVRVGTSDCKLVNRACATAIVPSNHRVSLVSHAHGRTNLLLCLMDDIDCLRLCQLISSGSRYSRILTADLQRAHISVESLLRSVW